MDRYALGRPFRSDGRAAKAGRGRPRVLPPVASGLRSGRSDEARCHPRDIQLFVEWHDIDGYPRVVDADSPLFAIHRAISLFVDFDAERLQTRADLRSDCVRVLTDAGPENHRISASEHGHVCADILTDAIAE